MSSKRRKRQGPSNASRILSGLSSTTAIPLSVRPTASRPDDRIRVFDNGGSWYDAPRTDDIVVRTITPEMAQSILEHHSKPNRRLRPTDVRKYTASMAEGYWQLVNPLHFDEDGFMRDGQHRMHACMKSGETIDFYIRFGTTEEELLSLDEGASRSTRDVAAIRGLDIRHSVLSAISYLLEFSDIKRVTPREKQSIFIDTHLDAANWVCDRLKKAPYNSNVVLAAVIRAYYHCKDSPAKLERLEKFINIYQGTDYPAGEEDTAAMIFKEYLLTSNRKRSTGPDRKKTKRNAAWCLRRFLDEVPSKNVRRGNPVELFPLPEEAANHGKIVI